MARKSGTASAQFTYWHARRRGRSQSAIARDAGVTRQAVSKSVKLQERAVMYRLLETAQSSGILVEWQDARLGLLVGLSPQLGHLAAVLIIDDLDRVRVFYDQTLNRDPKRAALVMQDLVAALAAAIGIEIEPGTPWPELVSMLATLCAASLDPRSYTDRERASVRRKHRSHPGRGRGGRTRGHQNGRTPHRGDEDV